MKQNHDSPAAANFNKNLNYSIFFLLIVAAVLIFASTNADPDLWGHVRFGVDILENAEITRVDPYSYLSGDQPQLAHAVHSALYGMPLLWWPPAHQQFLPDSCAWYRDV